MRRGKDKQETVLKLGKQFKLSKLQQLVNKAVQQHPDLFQQVKVKLEMIKQSDTQIQELNTKLDQC